jgi:uncharacterized protein
MRRGNNIHHKGTKDTKGFSFIFHEAAMLMTRQDIERKIHEHSTVLREKYKVARLGIFGSYAVNEQTEDSDIDFLVEFSETPGLEFFDLQFFLEMITGKRIDLVTPKALKPLIKEDILREVIYL